jgi:hypothetical protein
MYFVLKIKLIVMTDWSVENMNPGIAQNWRLIYKTTDFPDMVFTSTYATDVYLHKKNL